MKDAWRHFAAEFVGTFALTFVGGGAIITSAGTPPAVSITAIAFAHGLILALMVTATMNVSGHINPAVTVAFLITRRIESLMAVIHWVAQITGAIIAAWALKVFFPIAATSVTRLGGQSISSDISLIQAVGLEAIATFFLVFVVFATVVDPRGPKVGGFAIGLTVTADIFAIGALTGASMNPARSFGPAVVSGIYEGQTAYWVGPILGAIVAGLLYDKLFMPRAESAVTVAAAASST